jgi:hypothetical protein
MDFEQQLRAAFAPCDPRPALRTAILARRSALRWSGRRSGQGSRTILFGVIIAVAAAAAMLASQLMQQPAIQGAAAVTAQEPDPVPAVVADPLPPTSPAPALTQEKPAVVDAIPVAKPIIVIVELRNDATGAAIPAVEASYAALLDNLRTLPDVMLIEHVPGVTAPTATADYRLVVTGSGPMTGSGAIVDGRFTMRISENPIESAEAGTIARPVFRTSSDIATPLETVASLMKFARGRLFPPDPADIKDLQLPWAPACTEQSTTTCRIAR